MKNKEIMLYGLLAVVLAALIYSQVATFSNLQKGGSEKSSEGSNKQLGTDTPKMNARLSRMSLTGFDVALAKQFMDKDNDGRCDACGMPVEMCISSGQLQCNMDPSSTIGVLGSQHIHADWKVYVDGKQFYLEPFAMDMSNMNANITSSFIHVDKGANRDSPDCASRSSRDCAVAPEKTSDVLHMHAKGVPLWLFFRSIGGDFNGTCLTLPDNPQFCSAEGKTLTFYVNGKQNNEFGNYVFNNLDKILISYGDTGSDVQAELGSITDFAKGH